MKENHRTWRATAGCRYSDGWLMLAKHGYRIVIPEMVAYEAARMTSKWNTDSVFRHDPHAAAKADAKFFLRSIKYYQDDPKHQNRHEHKDEKKAIDNPMITIEPDHPTAKETEVANFLRLVNNAMQAKDADDIKREYLKALFEIAKRHKDIINGDIAAQHLVKHLPRDWSKPIFYLTDDYEAYKHMKAARPDLQINRLNGAGYLEAMRKSDLLRPLGIHIQNRDIAVDTINELKKDHMNKRGKESTRELKSVLDTPGLAGVKNNSHPFRWSIDAIKEQVLADFKKDDMQAGSTSGTLFSHHPRNVPQTGRYTDKHKPREGGHGAHRH